MNEIFSAGNNGEYEKADASRYLTGSIRFTNRPDMYECVNENGISGKCTLSQTARCAALIIPLIRDYGLELSSPYTVFI